MTREEEIQEAWDKYRCPFHGSWHTPSKEFIAGFNAGTEWADRHPEKKHAVTIDAWVAMDKDGKLYAYKRPPYKNLDMGKYYPSGNLDDDGIVLEEFDTFPFVTFENSPKKVKVTIGLEEEQ